MVTTINQIVNVFRTYRSQIASDKNRNNLSSEMHSDILAEKTGTKYPVSSRSDIVINKNHVKYLKNDENQTIVQIIRDETGKIVRTIPLSEQHSLDIFE